MPRRASIFGLLLSTVPFLMGTPVQADQLYQFVKFTCVPELNFFSIETFSVWNIGKGPYLDGMMPYPESETKLAKNYGVYSDTELEKHPYTCRIPATPLEQGWDNARPALEIKASAPEGLSINGHFFRGDFKYFSAAPDGVRDRLMVQQCVLDGEDGYRESHYKCTKREYDLRTQAFVVN